jgi:hypothetical protein
MRLSKLVFILFVCFYLPVQSFAWGNLGHRIVGQIADSYLTAKTRLAVQKILGTESVAMASTWADFIKSDTSMKYLSAWHYADFPKGLGFSEFNDELRKDTTVDAYTRIKFLVAELKKKNLSLDKKRMYLRLLIHIVGDVHQPLHVSPEGTEGGNNIKLTWMGQNTNLHTLWDSHLIEFQQLSYTEYAAAINHTTTAERRTLQKQPINQWLFDSYVISSRLHDEIKEANPRLSYLYNFQHIQILNDQLLKGGVHLAGLLNSIFG